MQPTHDVIATEARQWQATAILMTLAREVEQKQMGIPILNHTTPLAERKVADCPKECCRVLMAGAAAESCAELAEVAMATHQQVEAMVAICAHTKYGGTELHMLWRPSNGSVCADTTSK